MPGPEAHCPRCGRPLSPGDPEGLCPYCLLASLSELMTGAAEGEAPPAPPLAAPHERVGDYELLEELGRGGMGVVFRARDLRLQRDVALKLILTGQLASEAEVKRFHNEAEAAARLEHPHIVPIYEVGESGGRHFFAMKLVEGGTLAEWMAGGNVRKWESAEDPRRPSESHSPTCSPAHLLSKIARAVHHAHQRGVLHRDLKPANILLDAAGEPLVADFGLARRVESGSGLTLSGAVVGSPSYMAPEQAAGQNRQVTTAVDIYSLGAILYELLCGQPPFHAATPLETLRQVVEEEPVPPSRLNAKRRTRSAEQGLAYSRRSLSTLRIPRSAFRDLETICLKCLAKEPARRYATAEALSEDLERWLRHEPIQARPVHLSERALKWTRRHPARAGLIALALLAPTVIIAVLLVMGAQVRGQRNRAATNEARALAAQASAESHERALRQRAYAGDLFAAAQALEADDLGFARRLLADYQPHQSSADTTAVARTEVSSLATADLRGFEWRLLWERTRGQEAFTFTNAGRHIQALIFTPDGRTLVSGGADGIHLWNVEERRSRGSFPNRQPEDWPFNETLRVEDFGPLLARSPAVAEHLKNFPAVLDYLDRRGHTNLTRAVSALAFTPDGKHLLVASDGNDYVRSWNFATREFDFAVPESGGGLSVARQGDLFAIGNSSLNRDADRSAHPGSVLLYSLTARQLVKELPDYGPGVAMSPDGSFVAAAHRERGAVLWEVATGTVQPLQTHVHIKIFGRMAFSPDGKFLAATGSGEGVIWDTASKRGAVYLTHVDARSRVRRILAWSPDGQFLACAGRQQIIEVFHAKNFKLPVSPGERETSVVPAFALKGHTASVTALAYSPDGRRLASASDDGTIRLWPSTQPVEPGLVTNSLSAGANADTFLEPVTGCLIKRSGVALAVFDARHDTTERLLPGTENQAFAGFLRGSAHPASAPGTASSNSPADSDWLAAMVSVNLTTNRRPASLEIRSLPDGARRAWRELRAPPSVASVAGSVQNHMDVTSDGRWLAAQEQVEENSIGSPLPWVYLYAVDTGELVTRFRAGVGILHTLRFSPDGRWLVVTGDDLDVIGRRRATLFATASWQVHREMSFVGLGDDVSVAGFDPAGSRLATGGSARNSLRVWDVASGRLLGRCNGSVSQFHHGLVWSPDGRTIVTRGAGELKFWSAGEFRELLALRLRDQPLGFTADGRTLAVIHHGVEKTLTLLSPPTLAEIDALPRDVPTGGADQ